MVARSEGHSGSLTASFHISGEGDVHAAYCRTSATTSSPDTNYGPQPSSSTTPYVTDEALLASIPPLFTLHSDVSSNNPHSVESRSSANYDDQLSQRTSGVQEHAIAGPKRNQTLFIKHIKSCKMSEKERLVAKVLSYGKRLLSVPTGGNRTGKLKGGPVSPTPSRRAGRATGSYQQNSMRTRVRRYMQNTLHLRAYQGDIAVSPCLHCGVVNTDDFPVLGPSI
jgi:hypothetical protein